MFIIRVFELILSVGIFLVGLIMFWLQSAPTLLRFPVGFGLIWAGLSSGFRIHRLQSKVKDWPVSTLIGILSGAITGVVVEGATEGILGAEAPLSNATMVQQIEIGAIAGTVAGVFQSLASDIENKVLDRKNIGFCKMLKNAFMFAVIGAIVGVVGGAISGATGGLLASTNADEVAIVAFVRKTGIYVLRSFSVRGTRSFLIAVRVVTEERLNPDTENRRFEEHASEAMVDMAQNLAFCAVGNGAMAIEESHSAPHHPTVDCQREVELYYICNASTKKSEKTGKMYKGGKLKSIGSKTTDSDNEHLISSGSDEEDTG